MTIVEWWNAIFFIVIPSRIGVRDDNQAVVRQAHHPELSRRAMP